MPCERTRSDGERCLVMSPRPSWPAVALVAGCVTIGGSAGAATSTHAGRDEQLHHGRDHLDPDRPDRLELLLSHLRGEGLLRLHRCPGWHQRSQNRLQVRARRRRQRDDVQPAGQHADQPGPRVRHHRRGHGVVRSQLLRRGEDPDLRLQRLGQLGRPAQPLRRRWLGAVLSGRGTRARLRGEECEGEIGGLPGLRRGLVGRRPARRRTRA